MPFRKLAINLVGVQIGGQRVEFLLEKIEDYLNVWVALRLG
jgi:hypothetical protein